MHSAQKCQALSRGIWSGSHSSIAQATESLRRDAEEEGGKHDHRRSVSATSRSPAADVRNRQPGSLSTDRFFAGTGQRVPGGGSASIVGSP